MSAMSGSTAPRSLVIRATRPWLLKDMGMSNKQPGAGLPATFGAMQCLSDRAPRGLTWRCNPHHLLARKLVRSSPRQTPMSLVIGINHADLNDGSPGARGPSPSHRAAQTLRGPQYASRAYRHRWVEATSHSLLT